MNDLNGGGIGGGVDKKLAQKGRERESEEGEACKGRSSNCFQPAGNKGRRGKEGRPGRRCGKVAWRGVVSLLSAPRRQVQSESDVVTA